MTDFTELSRKIDYLVPRLSEWCPAEKSHTLFALVLALRPALTIEIGTWQGASLLPMALAHRAIGHGRIIAVDPWSSEASIEGQVNKDDIRWWSEVDHEKAYQTFIRVLAEEGLSQLVEVVRCKSDDFDVPDGVGLAHIDGSHTEQAVRDVQKFIPKMAKHGIICMDDYQWSGGGVKRACAVLESSGWEELYPLSTGGVWRRK